MIVQLRFRRGTTIQWETANPILANGEPGWDTDMNMFKIGDGTTPWIGLDWHSYDIDVLNDRLALTEAARDQALASETDAETAAADAIAAFQQMNKGQPGGVAALDVDGRVVDADGNPVGGAAIVQPDEPVIAELLEGAFWFDEDDPSGAGWAFDASAIATGVLNPARLPPEALAQPDTTGFVKVDRSREPVPLRMTRASKDANGIFTTIEWYRAGGGYTSRAARSVLSGGTSPTYTTRTLTEYGLDGTTVLRTTTFTLAYDVDGDLTSETVA